jgi:hypothetical protein
LTEPRPSPEDEAWHDVVCKAMRWDGGTDDLDLDLDLDLDFDLPPCPPRERSQHSISLQFNPTLCQSHGHFGGVPILQSQNSLFPLDALDVVDVT